MKIALLGLFLCIPALAFAQQPAVGTSPANTRFDGTWAVTLIAPDYTDAHGTALGFRYDFTAQVKNGVLHGEHGVKDQPTWLALDGTIQPDGTALFTTVGVTGKSPYSAGNVPIGTRFTYHVKAHFDQSKGTGNSVEGRPRAFTFVKQ